MTPPGSHLTDEQLARLVDSEADALEAGAYRGHLLHCRSCMAAYAEAVRIRAAHLRGHFRGQAPPEFVELARRVAPVRPLARDRSAWAWRGGLAVAALLATLLVVVPRGLERAWSVPLELTGPVQTALVHESHFGLMYPGAETAPVETVPVFRAGEAGASLTPVLLELTRESALQPENADLLYWLTAGQLADDNLPAAEHSLRTWRECCPRDRRLPVLEAVLAYRLSDLVGAHRILTRALEEDPTDPLIRFDLSVVLVSLDRHEEAADFLRGVIVSMPNELLGYRALALLESLETS